MLGEAKEVQFYRGKKRGLAIENWTLTVSSNQNSDKRACWIDGSKASMPFGLFGNGDCHSANNVYWPLNDVVEQVLGCLNAPLGSIFSLDTHLVFVFHLVASSQILKLLVSLDLHFELLQDEHLIC